ncbi:MAG: AbrB/MazE/SpoVT family DNA-binding domain-containing protein [Candidatus Bathyarchaeota archaeon]|nr:AbrB/MazE/SpoVT family DNA-binding domain-containing protein [Candidatus Bathyarchaeota archaeon]
MTKETEKINEEQRKLQVTGGSTFILSLPKDWATKNDLKRGSSMIVREEEDGSLSIAPSSFPKKEKQDEALIRANPNDNPDAIMRTAISAYLNGYNLLRIRAQGQKVLSSKLRNYLKHFARHYLVGTEIVIDTSTELTLQVLLNYPELTVQNALSRMSIIGSSMQKEALLALGKLDYTSAKAVIETDREVNRFGLYIVRLLKLAVSNQRVVKEIGLGYQKECLGYRLIAKSVERSADHATKIAENTLLLKEPVEAELMGKISDLSNLANSMFENSMEALFKHDFNLAESVIEKLSQAHKLEKEAVMGLPSASHEEIVNLRLIIESLRRIGEYAADISEVVLNLNVESVLS